LCLKKRIPIFLAVNSSKHYLTYHLSHKHYQVITQSKAGYFLPHLNSVSALPGKTQNHRNNIFTQMQYYCISRLLPIDACFFSLVDLQLMLKLVISEVQHWIVWGHNSGAMKLRLFAAAIGLYCMHNAMMHCLTEEKIISVVLFLIADNIGFHYTCQRNDFYCQQAN